MTASAMPKRRASCAVSLSASAASPARAASFHRIAAAASGEATEKMACSSISTRSARARARAPPLPPSPMITASTGVRSWAIASRFSAMAKACPRSSAGSEGSAPGMSIRVITGRRKRSAWRIRRRALRKPSGRAIPKRRATFSLVLRPFWFPITITVRPSSCASPPTTAASSPKRRSPRSSTKPLTAVPNVVQGEGATRMAGQHHSLPAGGLPGGGEGLSQLHAALHQAKRDRGRPFVRSAPGQV